MWKKWYYLACSLAVHFASWEPHCCKFCRRNNPSHCEDPELESRLNHAKISTTSCCLTFLRDRSSSEKNWKTTSSKIQKKITTLFFVLLVPLLFEFRVAKIVSSSKIPNVKNKFPQISKFHFIQFYFFCNSIAQCHITSKLLNNLSNIKCLTKYHMHKARNVCPREPSTLQRQLWQVKRPQYRIVVKSGIY